MVHEKYKYINGKRYGPYLYENRRIGDKVFTTYLGKHSEKRAGEKIHLPTGKTLLYFFFALVIFGLIGFAFYSGISPTGKISLDISSSYHEGEILDGQLKLNLQQGELIPADSKIFVSLGGFEEEFALSELAPGDGWDVVYGDFYAEGSDIYGNGSGYGLAGVKKIYPTLDFELLISGSGGSGKEKKEKSNETSESREAPKKEKSNETSESKATPKKEVEEAVAEEIESIPLLEEEEPSGEGDAGITGAIVFEDSNIISGQVSKNEEFTYDLEDGETAELVYGSVEAGGWGVDDSEVDIKVSDKKVEVSTDYYIEEEGFGEEYLGKKKAELNIALNNFNLTVQNDSVLKIKLVYRDALKGTSEIIVEVSRDISVDTLKGTRGDEDNATEIEINRTNVTGIDVNITGILNQTNVTVIEINQTNVTLNLSFAGEIGKITIRKGLNYTFNLSEHFAGVEIYELNISNISGEFEGDLLRLVPELDFAGSRFGKIFGYYGNDSVESNEFEVVVSSGAFSERLDRGGIRVGKKVKWVKNISLEVSENLTIQLPGLAENISVRKVDGLTGEESEAIASITGKVSAELNLGEGTGVLTLIEKMFSRITGRAVTEFNETSPDGMIEVVLGDDALEYVIEYDTPAPEASEENVSYGKKVVISGPDKLNYTDIVSFTDIPEIYSIGQESRINIYWEVINESAPPGVPQIIEYRGIPFDAYDFDENGLLDYVEWSTPHLSNQTFRIILITKAEHLDENRTLIEDVYELVKERDNNWTSPIPAGHYVRVTFEENLTENNDITIYARTADSCSGDEIVVINGIDVPCNIYQKKKRIDEIRRLLE